ncbi:hypothetical protein DFH08DRAFT_711932 [Mycena albidolilacea]|uniref:Uncharacterized protein n=1 Tax=Mycena albidolilacea TaxID=1033008 RepID=A0AAD6ZHG4_9AGAR|nr:hypothetical protein DFH08DRAFT_711932 [Mycena albidolilacea]
MLGSTSRTRAQLSSPTHRVSRRWPLHKDDTLSRSGRPTGLNIYASFCKNG